MTPRAKVDGAARRNEVEDFDRLLAIVEALAAKVDALEKRVKELEKN